MERYDVTFENHVEGFIYPETGIYYEFRFGSYSEEIDRVESTLFELADAGIVVIDAWYQAGDTMCVSPDGRKGMNVIVMPRFILRLEKHSSKMKSSKFYPVDRPEPIFCGYNVARYHLVLE